MNNNEGDSDYEGNERSNSNNSMKRTAYAKEFVTDTLVEIPPDKEFHSLRLYTLNRSVRILLPTIHKCSGRCRYKYMFGFPIELNQRYNTMTKKCNNWYVVSKHESPPIVLIDDDLFIPTGEYIRPDDIVIGDPDITLVIEFPLEYPVKFNLTSSNGFTRRSLLKCIRKVYTDIYTEESISSTIEVQPRDQRSGLQNRPITNGKYKIFGYDLENLYLEGIIYNSISKVVYLEVGS